MANRKDAILFRRDGTPYTNVEEFCRDMLNDKYRCVKQEELPNGVWISTVWTGISLHNASSTPTSSPPKIFETLVFLTIDDESHVTMQRYGTEAEAIQGHETLVRVYSKH